MADIIFNGICYIITCVMIFVLSVILYRGSIEIIRNIKDDMYEIEKFKKSAKYYSREQLDYINYGGKVDYYGRRID